METFRIAAPLSRLPYHPRTSSRHLLEPGESPHIATRSSSLATHSSSPRRIRSIWPLARTRLLLSRASRSLSFPRRLPPGVLKMIPPPRRRGPSVLFYPVMGGSARVERGPRGAAPLTTRAGAPPGARSRQRPISCYPPESALSPGRRPPFGDRRVRGARRLGPSITI